MNVFPPVLPQLAPSTTKRRRSLCGDCLLKNVCAKAKATVPSVETVRKPQTRLAYQNYLVRLGMPHAAMIDYHLNALSDFLGRFVDEKGATIPAPGIASFLRPGAPFWFRDQLVFGVWKGVEDVPGWRREAAGRWRIIGTVIDIRETVQPICPRR